MSPPHILHFKETGAASTSGIIYPYPLPNVHGKSAPGKIISKIIFNSDNYYKRRKAVSLPPYKKHFRTAFKDQK